MNQFLEVNSLGQLGWSDWATFLDILDSMRVSLAQSPTLQSVYRWVSLAQSPTLQSVYRWVRLAQSPTLQSEYRWGQPSTVIYSTYRTVSIQVKKSCSLIVGNYRQFRHKELCISVISLIFQQLMNHSIVISSDASQICRLSRAIAYFSTSIWP